MKFQMKNNTSKVNIKGFLIYKKNLKIMKLKKEKIYKLKKKIY